MLIAGISSLGWCEHANKSCKSTWCTNPHFSHEGDILWGFISDETTSKWLVGFSQQQRDQLADFQEQPVTLEKCTISKSKYTDNYEVILNKATTLPSPKKITPIVVDPPCQYQSSEVLILENLDNTNDQQFVKVGKNRVRNWGQNQIKISTLLITQQLLA